MDLLGTKGMECGNVDTASAVASLVSKNRRQFFDPVCLAL